MPIFNSKDHKKHKKVSSAINNLGNNNEHPNPNQAIWKAVIMQAIIDATNNSKKPEFKTMKRQALQWLEGKSQDFKRVCRLAGLDEKYVINKAKYAIYNTHKWKKKPTNLGATKSSNENYPKSIINVLKVKSKSR